MKTNSPFAQTILLPALVLMLGAFRGAAQIPVTSTPVTNRFDALPPASQSSTRSQEGGARQPSGYYGCGCDTSPVKRLSL